MLIRKKISPLRFIVASIAALLLVLCLYFFVINNWLTVQHAQIPTSFKELMLRKVEGPRIMIDSGSNSYYGINPLVLEQAFHMPVINLSDNVGYPLDHKFHYLARYAKPGDIIVLPLEWTNYTKKAFYDNYVIHVLDGSLSYYYQSLPLYKRLKFVFTHVPANDSLDAANERLNQSMNNKYHLENLNRYQKRLQKHHANSLGSGLSPERKGPHGSLTLDKSCDEALFNKFHVSQRFLDDLELLKPAVQDGVTVVFTWPAVVDKEGNGCYQSARVKKHLPGFVREIRSILEPQGFIIAGDPYDSVYPSEYMHDTYYHIIEPKAAERSQRLAQRMMEAGIKPSGKSYRAGDSIKALLEEVNNMLEQTQQGATIKQP